MIRRLVVTAAAAAAFAVAGAGTLASAADSITPTSPASVLVGVTVKPDIVISASPGGFTVTNAVCNLTIPGCYGGAGQMATGPFEAVGDEVWCWASCYRRIVSFAVPSLAPGASASFQFWPTGGLLCRSWGATGDPSNQVAERDETNNGVTLGAVFGNVGSC